MSLKVSKVQCYLIFGTILFTQASVTHASSKTQFCPAQLNSNQKKNLFKRTMSLGASFSHGCSSCDIKEVESNYLTLSGDAFWVRRNPVLWFLNTDVFASTEKNYLILENELKHPMVNLMPKSQLKSLGYNGLWFYNTALSFVGRLSDSTFSKTPQNSLFKQSLPLFGGIYLRKKRESSPSPLRGVLYASQFPDNEHVLFDLSVDGSKMNDLFLYQSGDKALYQKIEKNLWRDDEDVSAIVQKTIDRINSLHPTSIFAIDALFWDSLTQTFRIMQEHNSASPYVKFILNFLKRSGQLEKVFDKERYQTVFTAYLKTLRAVSNYNSGTPIFLGKVMTDTESVFQQNAPAIASLIATYITQFTNRDFFEDLFRWIEKIAYQEDSQGNLKPRNQAFYDDLTDHIYSISEIYALQKQLQRADYLTKDSDMTSPTTESHLKSVSTFKSGLINILIMQALGDLPLFIHSLSQSFAETNQVVKDFLEQNETNIFHINADKFFNHFPEYLKPETMHPDVLGAQKIAQVINEGLCE